MRRNSSGLAVIVLVMAAAIPLFSQAPATGGQVIRPGAPTPGAAVPGMPTPRDAATRPQTGTASLKGRAVSQQGTPLRRAQITLTAADVGPGLLRRVTTTDAEGRYEFIELPAGRFSVSAAKAGYVTLQFGQRRPYEAGTPVTLTDGQGAERIDFTLPRGGVISARITDEFGEPIANAQVQVQRYQYRSDGQRRLTTVNTGSPLTGTDDRGLFRAYGLMPGEYVVQASMRPALAGAATGATDTSEGFSPTFYPGTLDANSAQAVNLGVGQELSVQFALISSRMSTASGRVVDSAGRPAAGAQITLRTQVGNTVFGSAAGAVAADGSFLLSGLSPGEHTIEVRTQGRANLPVEAASHPIVVTGTDLTGLEIATTRGTTVTGRVVFEGTAPRTETGALAQRRVTAAPVDSNARVSLSISDPLANGVVDDVGNFRLAGVAGRVFFDYPAMPGWMLKSVLVGGEDFTDRPIDLAGRDTVDDVQITMTDKLTGVSGHVTDVRGQLLRDYVVVILPVEEREPSIASRLIRVVRPDTAGRYQVLGLRPGRYVATAVEAIEQGRQFAPEFQQQLRRGAPEFTLREGQPATVDLRLTPDL